MNIKELYKISPRRRKGKLSKELLELPEIFNMLHVGYEVVCIEDRGNGRYGLLGWNNGNYEKIQTLTYGKSYKVIEINRENNKIKLTGDDNTPRWYGLKRFIFSIRNKIIPKNGYYVIIKLKKWRNKLDVQNFFDNNIGYIYSSSPNYSYATDTVDSYDISVIYYYVPEDIRRYTGMRMVQGGYIIHLDSRFYEIVGMARSEKKLKLKLTLDKYNL